MISGIAWKVAWLALAFLLSRVIVALAWDATPPGAQTINQVFQNGAAHLSLLRLSRCRSGSFDSRGAYTCAAGTRQ
jgi:hypothetical protein